MFGWRKACEELTKRLDPELKLRQLINVSMRVKGQTLASLLPDHVVNHVLQEGNLSVEMLVVGLFWLSVELLPFVRNFTMSLWNFPLLPVCPYILLIIHVSSK